MFMNIKIVIRKWIWKRFILLDVWLQDAESGSSQRRTEKNDSYPPQSGSGWGRELRNRFVFNNNERDRTSSDYTLRSHYTEQGSSRRDTKHVYWHGVML